MRAMQEDDEEQPNMMAAAEEATNCRIMSPAAEPFQEGAAGKSHSGPLRPGPTHNLKLGFRAYPTTLMYKHTYYALTRSEATTLCTIDHIT